MTLLKNSRLRELCKKPYLCSGPQKTHVVVAKPTVRNLKRLRTEGRTKLLGYRSPDEIAKELGMNQDLKYEWLHLSAFAYRPLPETEDTAGSPQEAMNLVLGTYHSNTMMMIDEEAVKALVQEAASSHHRDRIEAGRLKTIQT